MTYRHIRLVIIESEDKEWVDKTIENSLPPKQIVFSESNPRRSIRVIVDENMIRNTILNESVYKNREDTKTFYGKP
jgi:hypothetical protein